MTQIAFLLHPEMTALDIEYDPDPPFDSGSLETADEETRRRATALVTGGEEARATA